MIKGYLKHIRHYIYLIIRHWFYRRDLDFLCELRYKVISEIGLQEIKDIVKRLEAGKRRRGYCNYKEAIWGNHKAFFKGEYEKA